LSSVIRIFNIEIFWQRITGFLYFSKSRFSVCGKKKEATVSRDSVYFLPILCPIAPNPQARIRATKIHLII
jgi:hypothetical protein